ncbi:ABC-type nitrate/sulfonate/bicarbonate transport system substrate-binding protein [Azospirillum lipoferum]|nr:MULTISPECIES: ABC transporter substrate-binding protein [Azospirillum]MCP1611152.1 ABC-type nitrate/sulfonate/bicarbonate transport system substrate-binding protein [Azospirillum lipoferum]MDW5533723.1 ABC transporter substrate-binding protein [Azospirillum sp. NL1]
MTVKRRDLLTASAAGMFLASVRPLGAQVGAQAQDALSIVLPNQFILAFIDVLFAQAGGYFEREGLRVGIEEARGSSMALQQVLGGNATIARIGAVDHIRASAQPAGRDLVAFGTVQQSSPWFVVSLRDKPVSGPQDMANRTVGIQSVGGTTETLLDIMLAARGVDRTAVQRVVVNNSPAGVDLIRQGRIDAYFVTASIAVALQKSGQPVHLWNTDTVAPTPGFCYAGKSEVIERHGPVIQRYVRAVRTALLDLIDGKVAVADALKAMERYDMAEARNPELAAAIYKENIAFLLADGRENLLRNVPKRWQSAYDLMVSCGFAPPNMKQEDLYTNRFIDAL